MRLRPVRTSFFTILVGVLALCACSDDATVGPPPPHVQEPSVWSEITDLVPSITMYSLWAESENNIIAVGRGGQIWQWNGAQWTQLPNSDSHDLFAIDGNASGGVMAVGDRGTMLTRINGTFVKSPPVVYSDLHDVWPSSTGEFFIVGDDGIIMKAAATSASDQAAAIGTPLLSIWGANDTDIFAVGVDGVILHYDGGAWANMTSPTTELLAAIDGTSATDVYAVGGNGTIIHYDGANWTPIESHTNNLLQTCCTACGPAIAGANGNVVQWTNGSFHSEEIAGAAWLYAMTHAGEDTWVVGAHAVLRHDGVAWSSEARGLIPAIRAMTSSPSIGLVTAGDNGSVMLGEPSKWQAEDAGALQRLNTIWTSPAGDIFAAGTNRIYRRTAGGWVMENSEIIEYYDIGGNSDAIFAVGKNGAIRKREITGWKIVYSDNGYGGALDLHAISMTDDDGYIVGGGKILYYEIHNPQQDGTWTVRYSRDSYNFQDVMVTQTPAYKAIAVGTNGLSLGRGHNGTWEVMQVPVSATLYSLALGPDGDVYAAGAGGTLLHLVDDAWTLIAAPTTRAFFSVCTEGNALFLCGGDDLSGGFLFRYGTPSH